MEPTELEQLQDEYQQLNNELVVPWYRRFCREYGLPFHFWDELPGEEFDPKVAEAELLLHKKAMDLFNHLKPEVTLFKDKIVRFQFKSWDGEFSYTTWSVNEFLAKASDELFYLRNLEERFEKVVATLVILSSSVAFVGGLWLALRFLPNQLAIYLPPVLVGLIPAIGLGYWLMQTLRGVRKRMADDHKRSNLLKRIADLQSRLLEIRRAAGAPFP